MLKRKSKSREYLLYSAAVLVGVLVEFLGFRFEEVMIRLNFPARLGFSISLFLLIFSPLLSTGVIIYRYTGELLKAILLSAFVFPLALIIFLI